MKKKRNYVFCDFETTGLFDIVQSDKIVYPIEIGMIFTDENFVIYESFSYLIKWPELYSKILDLKKWPCEYLSAYKVHKIEYTEYLDCSIYFGMIAQHIIHKCDKYTKDGNKPILISDNIQFEWKLMEFLISNSVEYIRNVEWPFHYCGYDSSEILIRTGVGDPKPEHRALRDAALLHQHMIRAVEKVNGWLK